MVCSMLSTSDCFTPAVAEILVWTFEVVAVIPTHNFATSPSGLWLEGYLSVTLLTGIVCEDKLLHFPLQVMDHWIK